MTSYPPCRRLTSGHLRPIQLECKDITALRQQKTHVAKTRLGRRDDVPKPNPVPCRAPTVDLSPTPRHFDGKCLKSRSRKIRMMQDISCDLEEKKNNSWLMLALMYVRLLIAITRLTLACILREERRELRKHNG
jgi:hypothetical protein